MDMETLSSGAVILRPKILNDDRGYFCELFVKRKLLVNDALFEIQQINLSFSKKNVFRGLHYQRGPLAQGKFVMCASGHIIDVVVGLDGKAPVVDWFHLDDMNRNCVYVPPGCLHGFYVLSEGATLIYACSNPYNKNFDGAVSPMDPVLQDAGLREMFETFKEDGSDIIMSPKDVNAPALKDAKVW